MSLWFSCSDIQHILKLQRPQKVHIPVLHTRIFYCYLAIDLLCHSEPTKHPIYTKSLHASSSPI